MDPHFMDDLFKLMGICIGIVIVVAVVVGFLIGRLS